MEARIEQCHLKGVDDNEAVAKANVAKAAKSKKGKTPRKAPAGWSDIKIVQYTNVYWPCTIVIEPMEMFKRSHLSHNMSIVEPIFCPKPTFWISQ